MGHLHCCLLPRPVHAIRVIARGLAKNGKKSQISVKKVPEISPRKSYVFCDDHGIFPGYEMKCNTSLPSICGPFHLIATKCVGVFFP